MKTIWFDLETCPLPDDQLSKVMPRFEAPRNYKDADKIRTAVLEQEAAWKEKAALSPLTGSILAAAYGQDPNVLTILDADEIGEPELIRRLFAVFTGAGMGAHYKVGGFNIIPFDLPFLIKRAWAHRIAIPSGLFTVNGRWGNWASWVIDLRAIWSLGERDAPGSLKSLSAHLGIGEKLGDGADFARMWREPATRDAARAYLLNDVALLCGMADVFQHCSPSIYGGGRNDRNDRITVPVPDKSASPLF
ncbi:hypothetical protein [Thiocapsa sp. N5-Cardenillas]|uniref:hypothetical protein n=1 Tax=Thiocapsa sp. N5-Cardenillas TaxID=3137397 RepID=UPI0035B167EF